MNKDQVQLEVRNSVSVSAWPALVWICQVPKPHVAILESDCALLTKKFYVFVWPGWGFWRPWSRPATKAAPTSPAPRGKFLG